MKFGNRVAAVSTTALACLAAASVYGALGRGSPANAQQAGPAAATMGADDSCANLAGLKLDQVQIVSARSQAANAPVAGVRLPGMTGNPDEGPPVAGLPAFCRVVGHIHPEPGSDIAFEVWMPAQGWDGRLNGIGTGGFAGSVEYVSLGLALKAGEVGVSTDTGHSGTSFDSAWAKGHPERVRDYGWRAVHLTTVAAKQLVAAFYGHGPDHSYFVGCSNGGRQGMMEASRFPDDYDGIVSGAPAAVWTDLAMAMINSLQAQSPPGEPIRAEQAHLLQDEVLRQCDGRDGQIDGLVADPRQCRFDVSKLACGVSSSSQCFSAPQLTALRRIYAGPHDRAGRPLTASYLPSGSEVGAPSPTLGWDGYILTGPSGRPQSGLLVGGLLKDLVQTPFATPETFDFNTDPARLKAAVAEDLDAKPNLRRFFDRGGKLILWHGWADAAIPPGATLRFHQAILRDSGPRAKDSMRLFMVPGVQHCLGGTGPDVFGQLNAPQPGDTPERSMTAALQAWVETRRSPDTFVGRRGLGGLMGIPATQPEKQRLLCTYPATAVLKPGADPDKAASYSCRSAALSKTRAAG